MRQVKTRIATRFYILFRFMGLRRLAFQMAAVTTIQKRFRKTYYRRHFAASMQGIVKMVKYQMSYIFEVLHTNMMRERAATIIQRKAIKPRQEIKKAKQDGRTLRKQILAGRLIRSMIKRAIATRELTAKSFKGRLRECLVIQSKIRSYHAQKDVLWLGFRKVAKNYNRQRMQA